MKTRKTDVKATKHFMAKIMILLALWLQLPSMAASQTNNQGLELFKRFVNGQVPVKEAVVYRRISRPNGDLINQDWVRFGYQDGSWHAERLTPDTNNPARLLPPKRNVVCGASFSHLWIISDQNIHVADKTSCVGSAPESFGSLWRSLTESSLTLGIPVPAEGIGRIHWKGLEFASPTVVDWNDAGPLKTNLVKGCLHIGPNGLPASAEHVGTGKLSGAKVSYEYESSQSGIPKAFTVTTEGPDASIYRYEFLSLKLGRMDLQKTGGYVPQMFGDPSMRRIATIWTNSLPYTVLGNTTIPAFETKKPKQIGSIVIGGTVVISITFLALAFRRWKTTKMFVGALGVDQSALSISSSLSRRSTPPSQSIPSRRRRQESQT